MDEQRQGPQPIRNKLAEDAATDWLLPVDDDDTLHPDCLQVLYDNREGADIVYPFTRMVGRNDWCPNRLFNPRTLMRRPFIPVTALIRRDLWLMLAGQRHEPLEDWRFYQRALLHGARFKCVPEVLWDYHFEVNEFQKAA